MSNALEALRVLQGSGNRTASLIAGRQAQEQRVRDMKRNLEIAADPRNHSVSGATHADVDFEQNQLDLDPDFGLDETSRINDIENVNDAVGTYNRPDVTGQRQAEQSFKLRLAGEPARVAGESNIKAAGIAQGAKLSALEQMLAGGMGGRVSVSGVGSVGPDPSTLQTQKDTAASGRIDQQAGVNSVLTRLKALSAGKAHAARPGGVMDSLFGPSQKSLDDAEIAKLTQGNPNSGNGPQAGDTKQFPNGRTAVFDGKGWVAQ